MPDEPLRRRWDLYKAQRPISPGSFNIRLVAPGDYRKVFAWEEADDNIWTMSDFRVRMKVGPAGRIGSSANEKLDITVIPAKRRWRRTMKHLARDVVCIPGSERIH